LVKWKQIREALAWGRWIASDPVRTGDSEQ
jgi:hypothetical protein